MNPGIEPRKTLQMTKYVLHILVAPAQLVFPNVDLNRMFPFEDRDTTDRTGRSLSEYVAKTKQLHEKLIATAKKIQTEKDAQNIQSALLLCKIDKIVNIKKETTA